MMGITLAVLGIFDNVCDVNSTKELSLRGYEMLAILGFD